MNQQITVKEDHYPEIARLHKAAAARVISSPTKFILMGLGAFGLLVGPVGMPAAVAVALPFVYGAVKRAVQNGENAVYMKESGIFAHLLTETELVRLTKLVGKEVVISQLREALDDGKALSGAAINYLEFAGVSSEPTNLKTLLQGEPQPDQQTALPPTAIDVPATQMSTTTTSQPATLSEGSTDLAKSLAEQLTSRIVCAAPRTGKGVLIVTALDYLAELRPDVELWAIDLKNHPEENAYYARFDSDKLLRVNLMEFDKPAGADDAIVALFRDFNASTATTKLLWLNECVTAAAKLRPKLWKNIQDFAVGLCSAGSTGSDGQTGRFLWLDTQSPNVSDIGLRTNASRNVFRRVFLMNDDRSLFASAISSGFASEPQPEVLAQLEATGAKVMAYDSRSDRWLALPHYQVPASEPVESELAYDEPNLEQAKAIVLELARANPEGITASFCRTQRKPLRRLENDQIEGLFFALSLNGLGRVVVLKESIGFVVA